MSAQPDPALRDRLDRAIGAAPPSGVTADPRVLGQRVVRRRRAAAGAAVVALVLVGGAATTVLGDGGGGRAAQVAVDPATSAPPAPTPSPAPSTVVPTIPTIPTVRVAPVDPATADPGEAASTRLTDDTWATFGEDGELQLVPDATVLERVDDPVPTDDQSVALALSRPGRPVEWYLVEYNAGAYPVPTITSAVAGAVAGEPTLADWAAHLSDPVEPLDQGYGEPVTRAADGTLTPARGVRILDQQAGVDVGTFPAADTSTALVERDGTRLFLLVRTVDGATRSTAVPQPIVRVSDLAGFRVWATTRLAAGWRAW